MLYVGLGSLSFSVQVLKRIPPMKVGSSESQRFHFCFPCSITVWGRASGDWFLDRVESTQFLPLQTLEWKDRFFFFLS